MHVVLETPLIASRSTPGIPMFAVLETPSIASRFVTKMDEAIHHMAAVPELEEVRTDMNRAMNFVDVAVWVTDTMVAKVLLNVDSICQPSGSKERRTLLAIVQDLFVLGCARSLPLKSLYAQGVPKDIKDRFEATLGTDMSADMLSRLGNSKWHLFRPKQPLKPRRASRRARGIESQR